MWRYSINARTAGCAATATLANARASTGTERRMIRTKNQISRFARQQLERFNPRNGVDSCSLWQISKITSGSLTLLHSVNVNWVDGELLITRQSVRTWIRNNRHAPNFAAKRATDERVPGYLMRRRCDDFARDCDPAPDNFFARLTLAFLFALRDSKMAAALSTDIVRPGRSVRLVPNPDSCTTANLTIRSPRRQAR